MYFQYLSRKKEWKQNGYNVKELQESFAFVLVNGFSKVFFLAL